MKSLLLTHFLFLKAQVTIVIEGLQGRRGRHMKVSNVEIVCYTHALRTWGQSVHSVQLVHIHIIHLQLNLTICFCSIVHTDPDD